MTQMTRGETFLARVAKREVQLLALAKQMERLGNLISGQECRVHFAFDDTESDFAGITTKDPHTGDAVIRLNKSLEGQELVRTFLHEAWHCLNLDELAVEDTQQVLAVLASAKDVPPVEVEEYQAKPEEQEADKFADENLALARAVCRNTRSDEDSAMDLVDALLFVLPFIHKVYEHKE